MGIVFRQSLTNTLITYIGFAIGAVNYLFLFTRFLTDEYFGLVTVILSTAALMMPLMAFGVHNTLIKYFSVYKDTGQLDGFLTLMLLLPMLLILPVFALTYFAQDSIAELLGTKNELVKDYVWYIFLIAFAMAYFEVFYAWVRVHLKSVFGNFMKELFVRVGTMILLLLIYKEIISVAFFLKALVGLYLVRTLLMKLYAYSIQSPKLSLQRPENTKKILSYSSFIILGASAAIVLLEVDKVMINQFLKLENVAYYGVATYIAMVIIVPSRSMHQITYPLTAELLNAQDTLGLKRLYQKSSLTLFIASGLIFILIICNVNELYLLLPEAYRGGFIVVFIIGLIKVYDSFLGNINSILYNSEYYKSVLLLGIFLAILTVLFNLWLIPKFGIDGAAVASFLAFFIYNSLKLIYVKLKFNILPFTNDSLRVLLLLIGVGLPFFYLSFPFHPIVNIALKGLLIVGLYVGLLYRFKISTDVYGILSKYIGKNR